MKRYISGVIAAVLCLSLVGCGQANNDKGALDSKEQDATENKKITTVQDYDIAITMTDAGETIDLEGKYTGELADGKPQGEGYFQVEGEDDSLYVYEGSFSDGVYDGFGITTITNAGETLQMSGTYSHGEFTPTAGESFNFIGQLDLFGKFSVPENVIEYIDSNTEIFPVANSEKLSSVDLQDFSSKQFIKTRKQEQVGLVKLDLYAVQVFEDDYINNGKLTYLLAADDDGNYYTLYYLDSAEIYDEDTFTAYAVPCATSSFDNISGGTTNVIVMAACSIVK